MAEIIEDKLEKEIEKFFDNKKITEALQKQQRDKLLGIIDFFEYESGVCYLNIEKFDPKFKQVYYESDSELFDKIFKKIYMSGHAEQYINFSTFSQAEQEKIIDMIKAI